MQKHKNRNPNNIFRVYQQKNKSIWGLVRL